MTFSTGHLESSNSIAPFTGGISKDHDPASDTYSVGETILQTYDIGADGAFLPLRVRLPTSGDSNLETVCRFEFHDATTEEVRNSSPLSVADFVFQDLVDNILGGATATATNDGKAIRKIILLADNVSAGDIVADIGTFRVRALTTPKGAGSAP